MVIQVGVYLLVCTIFIYWDLKAYYLPGFWLSVLITLGFLFHISFGLIDSFLGFIVGGGLLFLLYLLGKIIYKKEVMGTGDIYLVAGIGAYWGVEIVLMSLYYGILIGGFWALLVLIFRKKAKHEYIPFGPSLILGSLLAIGV